MYARNGRIPFDQTPGGHRRFDLDEVRQALQVPEGAVPAPPARSRGTAGWLVDATELDSWANRRVSEDELPVIVRTLVAGSVPELEQSEFRGAEGVIVSGWDGLVNAPVGNPWVPSGQSAWEMGTSEDIARKADSDYEDRTANPLGLDRATTTLVFVTPRRWPNRDSWATKRRAEGKWKDVRVLDADSLEQWLDVTPGAHARVTRMLGRDPEGAADLESAWERWAGATSPVLPPQLVTAGRDEQMDQVWNWLHEREPTALSVVADSQEEATAFICASLVQLPAPDRAAADGRTLVVRSPQAWDEVLARTRTPLILIPTFPVPVTSEASDAGHHVVISLDRNGVPTGTPMTLPRLRQEPAAAALVEAGLKPERGNKRELAVLARRSLLALRRRLAVDASVARPVWAQPDRSGDVIPATLAGGWRDDREADRAVISSLAGRPYSEFNETLTPWLTHGDPPVRRVGDLWYIAAKEDAWILLHQFLTSDRLQSLHDCALEVLTAVDPALDLDPGERWTAAIHGKVHPWSSNLRSGLADTVALIGSREWTLTGDVTGREVADGMVRAILETANGDITGRTWASLDDVLPLLAEASPTELLNAVDVGAASGALHAVFDPAAEAEPFATPRHTGLLWALELLAWEPDYLGWAAVNLARLAQHDPGGRFANRPANSLREIFLPWIPHTRASLDERLDVIDRLRTVTPDVAWRLMVSILPTMFDSSMGTYEPRWRDGEPDPRPPVTVAEAQHHAERVVERLLEDVETSGAKWTTLIEGLQSLPARPHQAVVARLEAIDPTKITAEDRKAIIQALRSLIHQHRRFPNAEWALPTERLDHLQGQLDRFACVDSVSGTAWLFSQSATLPRPLGEDYAAEEDALTAARRDSVAETLGSGGLDGIWALGAASEHPEYVGAALADEDTSFDTTMIDALDDGDQGHCHVARGYVLRRFHGAGWTWAEPFLERAGAWSPKRQLAFLQCFAVDETTFDWADRFGNEVSDEYWRTLWPLLVSKDARPRAIIELTAHGRAHAAVGLLDLVITDSQGPLLDSIITETVIVEVLTKAAQDFDGSDVTMFAYHVENLLDFLNVRTEVERSTLAQLEWLYLPLFEHREREPRILHDELSSNPEFFVTVVSWVFRSEDDNKTTEVTPELRARAELGYRLLRSWHTPPEPIAEWVGAARTLLTQKGLIKVGDINIGHVLRYVPEDADGVWPTIAVRELIDDVASQDLEQGILAEVYNSRGATFRDLNSGGKEERALAKKYSDYARKLGTRWPRTRRMLEQIAEQWERDARREDHLSEIREDFWDH
jgi:hypothetical protein